MNSGSVTFIEIDGPVLPASRRASGTIPAGAFAGGEIEPGTFHGGEIEPGTFHGGEVEIETFCAVRWVDERPEINEAL